jgi:hypothetical protein
MGPLDGANLNHWTDKPEEEVIDSSSIVGPCQWEVVKNYLQNLLTNYDIWVSVVTI